MARIPDPSLADKRRRQILDAAMVCFRRRGFHQATMQEICMAAELSPGALYRYFRSKTDLISAIIEEDRRRALEPLESFGSEGDFFAGLMALTQAWIARAAEKDRAMIADVMAEAARDDDLRAILACADAPLREALTRWVRHGQARGQVDAAIDAEQAARVMLAAMEGMALRLVLLGKGSVAQALSDLSFVFERMFPVRRGASQAVRAVRGLVEPVA